MVECFIKIISGTLFFVRRVNWATCGGGSQKVFWWKNSSRIVEIRAIISWQRSTKEFSPLLINRIGSHSNKKNPVKIYFLLCMKWIVILNKHCIIIDHICKTPWLFFFLLFRFYPCIWFINEFFDFYFLSSNFISFFCLFCYGLFLSLI